MIIQETFKTIRGSLMTWLMTTFTVAVALSLAGVLALLSYRANVTLDETRAHLETEAFFASDISSASAEQLLELSIRPLGNIREIKLISKEEALKQYKASSGEDVQAILGVNPLPASVQITLLDNSSAASAQFVAKLKAIPEIAKISTNSELLSTLELRSQSLRSLAIAVGCLLGLTALGFLAVASRTTLDSRRDRIHTMNLLGARPMLVRAPLIIEGAMSGLIGGAMSSAVLVGLYQLSTKIISADLTLHESLANILAFSALVLGICGLVLGMVASVLTTWRRAVRI